jgi:hypothetical protein
MSNQSENEEVEVPRIELEEEPEEELAPDTIPELSTPCPHGGMSKVVENFCLDCSQYVNR